MTSVFSLDPHISNTPDFPKEGVTFYDIGPALENPGVLRQLISQAGGTLSGAVCVIELTGLNSRAKLPCDIVAIQHYAF